MYKKAEATWTVEEIDLSKDIHDWNNHLERHFISQPRTESSTKKLIERFSMDFQVAEARYLYVFQIMMETFKSF
jgi:ribonucleoside-diphosphate reductase subunit M2